MPRFDLISLTSHENSNHGRENYWKSGFQIPAPEEQDFLSFFLFIFKFFIKNFISLFLTIYEYLVLQIRYQWKQTFSTWFIWFLNNKTRYQKWLKSKIPSFVWRIWNWKEKKGQKIFDLLERGLKPQIFSNFPAHDLNLHVKWGRQDQIKTSF